MRVAGPSRRRGWQFGDEAERPSIRGNFLSNHAELLRLMALRGVGIIRVSDHVITEDLAAGRLVPVLAAYQPTSREAVWAIHSSREMSQRVRVFIDFIVSRLDQQLQNNS